MRAPVSDRPGGAHRPTVRETGFPSECPRATQRPACARCPPRLALCSAVLGVRAPTRTSGGPGRCRRTGCRGLSVSRLSAYGISPGRLGTGRRGGILSPTRAAWARLRARRRRESLRGWAEVLDRLRRENSTKLTLLVGATSGGWRN